MSHFPRAAWLRSVRRVLTEAPNDRFGYLSGQRRAGAATGAGRLPQPGPRHRRRRRDDVVIATGYAQGIALLVQVLAARGARPHRRRGPVRRRRRARRSPRRPASSWSACRSARDGIDVDALGAAWRRRARPDPVAPVADRRRAAAPSRGRAVLRWARRARRAGRSRTTTTPSTATTGRRSARCRGSRPTGSSTRARRARRSRPGCGSAGCVAAGRSWSTTVAAAKMLADRGSPRDRPAHVRRLPGPRRVRPAPAPDAPDLPAPPRRPARRAGRAAARAASRPASRPACTWSPGSRRTSTRRRWSTAALRHGVGVHGVTPYRCRPCRPGRSDLRVLGAERARDRRGGGHRRHRRGRHRGQRAAQGNEVGGLSHEPGANLPSRGDLMGRPGMP